MPATHVFWLAVPRAAKWRSTDSSPTAPVLLLPDGAGVSGKGRCCTAKVAERSSGHLPADGGVGPWPFALALQRICRLLPQFAEIACKKALAAETITCGVVARVLVTTAWLPMLAAAVANRPAVELVTVYVAMLRHSPPASGIAAHFRSTFVSKFVLMCLVIGKRSPIGRTIAHSGGLVRLNPSMPRR